MRDVVVVVAGGPAGLSAALKLGRCRRRVLLCDAHFVVVAAAEGVKAAVAINQAIQAEGLQ